MRLVLGIVLASVMLAQTPVPSPFATAGSGGGGSGTVASVGLAGTANQITVTGTSPITGSGSWTLSFPTNMTLPGTTTGTFSGNVTGNLTGTASTATNALSLGGNLAATYAPLASPTFTGTVTIGTTSLVSATLAAIPDTTLLFKNSGAVEGTTDMTWDAPNDRIKINPTGAGNAGLQVNNATHNRFMGVYFNGDPGYSFLEQQNAGVPATSFQELENSIVLYSGANANGLTVDAGSGPVRIASGTGDSDAFATERLRILSNGVISINPGATAVNGVSLGTDTLGIYRKSAGLLQVNTGTIDALAAIEVSSCTGCVVPAGAGTELQYRFDASTFGAMGGTSWDSSARTLLFTDSNANPILAITANPAGDGTGSFLNANASSVAPPSVSSGNGTQGASINLRSFTGGPSTDTASGTTGGGGGGLFLVAGNGAQANSVIVGNSQGGNGGGVEIDAGSGADGGEAAENSFGGSGGSFLFQMGNGGSATGTLSGVGGSGQSMQLNGGGGGGAFSAGTNTGGNGSDMTLRAGDGGVAIGGMSNTGGNGGNITLTPGSKGTGSTADGTDGTVTANGSFIITSATFTLGGHTCSIVATVLTCP